MKLLIIKQIALKKIICFFFFFYLNIYLAGPLKQTMRQTTDRKIRKSVGMFRTCLKKVNSCFALMRHLLSITIYYKKEKKLLKMALCVCCGVNYPINLPNNRLTFLVCCSIHSIYFNSYFRFSSPFLNGNFHRFRK